MIYKAGRKYIDLERVTAIEPILRHSGPFFYLGDDGDSKVSPPPLPAMTGARIDCQLHEKPIDISFPNTQPAEQQFDDLMAAWRSVVEKRQPSAVKCPRCLRIHAPNECALNARCPVCLTFHNSNEACPTPHQI